MADQQQGATAESNGVVRVSGAGIVTREDFHKQDRAAFLAGDETDVEEKAAPKKPAKKPAVDLDEDLDDDAERPKIDVPDIEDDEDKKSSRTVQNDDDEDPDADLEDDEDDDEPDDAADVEDDDDEDVTPAKKPDPKDRGKTQLWKLEKRMRADLDAKKAELQADFAKKEEAFKADQTELAAFRALKARAKYDPAAVLAHYGLGDDDWEPTARDLYARSKAGAADPKNREAAAAMQKQREKDDRIAALEKRLEGFEEKTTKAEKTAAQQQAFNQLSGSLHKAVKKDEKTPLAQKRLAADPNRTGAELVQVHLELWERDGAEPTAKQVTRAYEKKIRAELRALGIDPTTVAAAKAVTKAAEAKKAGGDGKLVTGKPTNGAAAGDDGKPLTGAALKAAVLEGWPTAGDDVS